MVKRQKEKQYQSAREHKAYSQLRSNATGSNTSSTGTIQRHLPFHCCALTLTPFTNPVCLRPLKEKASKDDETSKQKNLVVLFDSNALTQFILQYKCDPVTGHPATTRDIVTLHMDQQDGASSTSATTNNTSPQWYCPILAKPFSNHSKIVAILDRDTNKDAYVYSYEAYYELIVKAKNYMDLTTGKPFQPKKDVLLLFDSSNTELQTLRNIEKFWHIQNARKITASSRSGVQRNNTDVQHSVTATRIMEQLQKERQKAKEEENKNKRQSTNSEAPATTKKLKIYSDDVGGVQLTSGKASGSLTSSVMDITSSNDAREANEEEIRLSLFHVLRSQLKQKGIVKVHTNLGTLVLELHCDIVPRTCMNFLGLCQAQKYNQTKFHRLIPNFMIQGGGKRHRQENSNNSNSNNNKHNEEEEETSLWGSTFQDEFDDRLVHSGGGIVSMANAGPNTNKRQFFITFKSCPHLNRKHSVFGKVIDGMSVLNEMERVPTDKKDRPKQSIVIQSTEVVVNPVAQAEDLERIRIEERHTTRNKQQKQQKELLTTGKKEPSSSNMKKIHDQSKLASSSSTTMVGKYLPKSAIVFASDALHDTNNVESIVSATNKRTKNVQQGNSSSSQMAPIAIRSKQSQQNAKKTNFGDFSSW